jgi:hypothetical protein
MSGITFLSFICGWFSIPRDKPSPPGLDKRIDWLGAFIISAGLILVIFVLGQGELAPQKWRTPCESISYAFVGSSQNYFRDIAFRQGSFELSETVFQMKCSHSHGTFLNIWGFWSIEVAVC